ncbi:MAG: GDSL-type esterase/lipase family protein [Fibrobacterales bacterium]
MNATRAIKRTRSTLFSLCIFGIIVSVQIQALPKEVDLFLLMGQSNMQGDKGHGNQYPADPEGLDAQIPFHWTYTDDHQSDGWTTLGSQSGLFSYGNFGPEVTFARELKRAGYTPAIFKHAWGGTSVYHNWKMPGEGGLFDTFIARVNEAITELKNAGTTINVRGVVWIQGESDSGSEFLESVYRSYIETYIEYWRNTVAENSVLPIILGVDEQFPGIPEDPDIVQHHQDIARNDSAIAFTSMYGLEKADATHLTPAGIILQGRRIFADMVCLMKDSALCAQDSYQQITSESNSKSNPYAQWGQTFVTEVHGSLKKLWLNVPTAIDAPFTLEIKDGYNCSGKTVYSQSIPFLSAGVNTIEFNDDIFLVPWMTYFFSITSNDGRDWEVYFNNSSTVLGNLLAGTTSSSCSESWFDFDLDFGLVIENQSKEKNTGNLAYQKGHSRSSVWGDSFDGGRGNDGNEATLWASDSEELKPYYQVDLGVKVHITSVELVTRQDIDQEQSRENFEIVLSNNRTFNTFVTLGGPTVPIEPNGTWRTQKLLDSTYQYVRVQRTADAGHFTFSELRVFGDTLFPIESMTPQKVACIGNSITEAGGYVDYLREHLGEKFTVNNYGHSSRTLLKNGDYPYFESPRFRELLEWVPDVVTIMLGTNDSKTHNWGSYKSEFSSDLQSLIDTLNTLESTPHIILVLPPHAGEVSFTISGKVIHTEQIPMILKVAENDGLSVVDFNTPTLDKLDLMPDEVHPNDEGHILMGAVLYNGFLNYIINPPIAVNDTIHNDSLFSLRSLLQNDYDMENGALSLVVRIEALYSGVDSDSLFDTLNPKALVAENIDSLLYRIGEVLPNSDTLWTPHTAMAIIITEDDTVIVDSVDSIESSAQSSNALIENSSSTHEEDVIGQSSERVAPVQGTHDFSREVSITVISNIVPGIKNVYAPNSAQSYKVYSVHGELISSGEVYDGIVVIPLNSPKGLLIVSYQ